MFLTRLTREQIQAIKREHPPGTRIECIRCDDPYAPIPKGTRGTVKFVDDIGQVHPQWDNNRSLALNLEVDEWRKIEA